ncbi:MAG: hypothetical protein K0B11_02790 [Mariniphaga sp.]|nr:hypothetical protein [Mariniphaga sp.]
MKDFSKKVLKYALKKGIAKQDLEQNYQRLISDFYEYVNHVLLLRELQDYMYDY